VRRFREGAIHEGRMKEKSIGLFLLARKNEYQRLQETSAVAMAYHLRTPLEIHFYEGDEFNW
jgi:hypothetical protein